MYRFSKQTVGGFDIYTANPSVGEVHLRRFAPGVTPQNQASLNIYAAGSFELQAGSFGQVFEAGQTSLDLRLTEYPAGELCIERVVSGPATRRCVSRVGGGAWTRRCIEVSPEWVPENDGALIFFAGEVLEALAGAPSGRSGLAIYCSTQPA